MKTFFTLALVAFFFVSTAAFAGGAETTATAAKPTAAFSYNAFRSTTHADRLNVIVVTNTCSPVGLRIVNEAGDELYATTLKQSALQPLNTANLEPGTYTLELTGSGQTQTSTFRVN